MIVREAQDHIVFITQHDHAYISGEFLANLKKEFIPTAYQESLKFAIHQHDRAWITPDAHPLLNDTTRYPYSFFDYPEKLKLHFYKLGIEQVDQANSYAAILCSMHYASYYKDSVNLIGKQFYEREKLRQKHLINKLKIPHERLLNYQLKILQFCDDLSLYVCLNKPGVAKHEEIAFFKKGFLNSGFFHRNGETKIIAYYLEERNIVKFNSFPFEKPFEIKIPIKRISKLLIEEIGLASAFEKERNTTINIKFI